MTDPADTPHPLDDDDAEFGQADPGGITPVYGPLQKLGIYLLLAAGVLVVMTGIVAGNASAGSSFANTASGFNRFFTVLLLIGFVALLVSYQIPRIKIWLDARREQYPIHSRAAYKPPVSIASRELRLLSLVCGGVILVSWLTLLLPAFLAPWMALMQVACIFMGFGLSITIAIWHKGVLRAFGVGVAAAIFLSPFMFGALMLAMQFWSRGSMAFGFPMLPAMNTLILLSGLLCAGYVRVSTAYREEHAVDYWQ